MLKNISLGDRVISKKTGFPIAGYVMGLVAPIPWVYNQEFLFQKHDIEFRKWDMLYPDWKDKILVWVYLDAPIKPLTREEFDLQNPQNVEYENIREVISALYPIDDLEIFEE